MCCRHERQQHHCHQHDHRHDHHHQTQLGNLPMTHLRMSRNAQAGVGLIEVLVAVLVLSIGFVGIAALQARSLSTNNSAYARSMATVASYSILDAMRADLTGAESGNYNGTVTANACGSAGAALDTQQLFAW